MKCIEDRQSSRKIIKNNDSDDEPGSQEHTGEDVRNGYHKPTRTKEQTNRDK